MLVEKIASGSDNRVDCVEMTKAMTIAFTTIVPVRSSRRAPPKRRPRPPQRITRSRTLRACLEATESNLYKILGINDPNPASLSIAAIRSSYLSIAKVSHPDTAGSESTDFDKVTRAWSILSDSHLRNVYDSAGEEGLAAIQSISQRAEDIRDRYSTMSGEQLDYLSDTGQLVGGLLSASESDGFDPTSIDHEDACPRSIEEAIWNIENHPDRSVRYYGLWWIYKFKVAEAESALVNVLQTSDDRTSLGGFGLRRRAALALGAVASTPSTENQAAVIALSDALSSPDYFLRYRSSEALANIAQRSAVQNDIEPVFADDVVRQLSLLLKAGKKRYETEEAAKSGYSHQESLFNLDNLDPEVRDRIEAVFESRRRNEQRSRRTTMTPQLGVDEVGGEADEPYEWILKAVSAICSLRPVVDQDLLDTIEAFTTNSIPLIRYAACKALYALTSNSDHVEKIVEALQYGVEHHYSQRVLIRDLGDLGYCQGAAAVAGCPMVENSFKILALKNMLAKRNHDPTHPDVRNVLSHVDSLL